MGVANDIVDIIGKSAPTFNTSNLDNDEKLRDQGLDSLDIMSSLFAIEEKYNIKVDYDDIEIGRLDSINKIVKYVNRKAGL